MISVSVNPHGLLFRSPANDASWFSLSHSCAQIPESDPVARSTAPLLTITRVPYVRIKRIHLDLFLEFVEKFPHSNFQTDKHGD